MSLADRVRTVRRNCGSQQTVVKTAATYPNTSILCPADVARACRCPVATSLRILCGAVELPSRLQPRADWLLITLAVGHRDRRCPAYSGGSIHAVKDPQHLPALPARLARFPLPPHTLHEVLHLGHIAIVPRLVEHGVDRKSTRL